ncbi:PCI domain-containing protein [Coprinopsis sp. MPI-PUGE-AT-0042]|nr:PCI domain-containing protein [Coprinopsis sp. MPI-PUGE-AT-0042]
MASSTDSVSIFSEGTFEEQILELVNYLARSRSEVEQAAFTVPLENALKTEEGAKPITEDPERQKAVLKDVIGQVQGIGEGNEKEAEGFFNLLYAHLLSLFPSGTPELKEIVANLLQTVSSSSDRLSSKYRVISNLFNALPRSSPLRRLVYNAILEIAVANDDIRSLNLRKKEVEKWISEWDISDEEKSEFLKSISDAYSKIGQPAEAYEYSLLHVQKLPSSSDAAKAAAVQAIADALRLPTVFDFDALFKLDAVIAVKGHELFSLLQIFLNDGLPEYKSWISSHSGSLSQFNLEQSQLERKIRLLTLASLATTHVGQYLSYAKIAEGLEVDISEVEKWVIDVIRAGLVWGKLSQNTQNFHVTRAASRQFQREQWETLEKRLHAWKSGLSSVMEVIANAKRMAGHAPQQPQAVAT